MTPFESGKQDHDQQIRRQRWLTALATQSLGLLLYLASLWLGVVQQPYSTFWLCAGLLVLSSGAIGVLLWSGLNLRFADPSLTELQLSLGAVWASLFYYYGREIRGEVLALFLPFMFYGSFYFTYRQFLRVSAVALLAFSFVCWLSWSPEASEQQRNHEIFRLMVFTELLLAISYVGGRLSSLRRKLRKIQRELQIAYEQISRQALTDELTQAPNRRLLMERLEDVQRRFEQGGPHYSVAVLDLDHFKQINDRFGHHAGDAVLQRFVQTLQAHLRGGDSLLIRADEPLLARYGGEEFVLLLAGASLEEACACTERLRQALAADRHYDWPGGRPLTFSAGVAQSEAGEPLDQLLKRADRALYRAKDNGRDCVVAAPATEE